MLYNKVKIDFTFFINGFEHYTSCFIMNKLNFGLLHLECHFQLENVSHWQIQCFSTCKRAAENRSPSNLFATYKVVLLTKTPMKLWKVEMRQLQDQFKPYFISCYFWVVVCLKLNFFFCRKTNRWASAQIKNSNLNLSTEYEIWRENDKNLFQPCFFGNKH